MLTDKNPNVINLHAKMCQAEERVDEAIGYFKKAESYFVGEQVGIEARWNKSLLQLSDGRLSDGWRITRPGGSGIDSRAKV